MMDCDKVHCKCGWFWTARRQFWSAAVCSQWAKWAQSSAIHKSNCSAIHNTTRSQINHAFLFHRVLKILTAGRMLQISIARNQKEPEFHSLLTFVWNGSNRCFFLSKNSLKINLFLRTQISFLQLRQGLGPQNFKVSSFSTLPLKNLGNIGQNELIWPLSLSCFFWNPNEWLYWKAVIHNRGAIHSSGQRRPRTTVVIQAWSKLQLTII